MEGWDATLLAEIDDNQYIHVKTFLESKGTNLTSLQILNIDQKTVSNKTLLQFILAGKSLGILQTQIAEYASHILTLYTSSRLRCLLLRVYERLPLPVADSTEIKEYLSATNNLDEVGPCCTKSGIFRSHIRNAEPIENLDKKITNGAFVELAREFGIKPILSLIEISVPNPIENLQKFLCRQYRDKIRSMKDYLRKRKRDSEITMMLNDSLLYPSISWSLPLLKPHQKRKVMHNFTVETNNKNTFEDKEEMDEEHNDEENGKEVTYNAKEEAEKKGKGIEIIDEVGDHINDEEKEGMEEEYKAKSKAKEHQNEERKEEKEYIRKNRGLQLRLNAEVEKNNELKNELSLTKEVLSEKYKELAGYKDEKYMEENSSLSGKIKTLQEKLKNTNRNLRYLREKRRNDKEESEAEIEELREELEKTKNTLETYKNMVHPKHSGVTQYDKQHQTPNSFILEPGDLVVKRNTLNNLGIAPQTLDSVVSENNDQDLTKEYKQTTDSLTLESNDVNIKREIRPHPANTHDCDNVVSTLPQPGVFVGEEPTTETRDCDNVVSTLPQPGVFVGVEPITESAETKIKSEIKSTEFVSQPNEMEISRSLFLDDSGRLSQVNDDSFVGQRCSLSSDQSVVPIIHEKPSSEQSGLCYKEICHGEINSTSNQSFEILTCANALDTSKDLKAISLKLKHSEDLNKRFHQELKNVNDELGQCKENLNVYKAELLRQQEIFKLSHVALTMYKEKFKYMSDRSKCLSDKCSKRASDMSKTVHNLMTQLRKSNNSLDYFGELLQLPELLENTTYQSRKVYLITEEDGVQIGRKEINTVQPSRYKIGQKHVENNEKLLLKAGQLEDEAQVSADGDRNALTKLDKAYIIDENQSHDPDIVKQFAESLTQSEKNLQAIFAKEHSSAVKASSDVSNVDSPLREKKCKDTSEPLESAVSKGVLLALKRKVCDKNDNISKDMPLVVKTESIRENAVSEQENSVSVQEKWVSEQGQLAQYQGPVVSNKGPLVSDKGPVCSDKGSVVSDKGPVVSDKGPEVSDKNPVLSDKNPDLSNKKPGVSYQGPVVPLQGPTIQYQGQAVTNQGPVVPFQKPILSFQGQGPIVSDPGQVMSDQGPIVSYQGPGVPFQGPAVPFQRPDVPFQGPDVPFQGSVVSFQGPCMSFQGPGVPFQGQVVPFQGQGPVVSYPGQVVPDTWPVVKEEPIIIEPEVKRIKIETSNP